MHINWKAVAVLPLAIAMMGCGDSESSKKRLLETGKKYTEEGKLKEASIVYRRLIQKDAKYGEAYYQLGLLELKRGRPSDALHALRRAAELQPENDDAHSKLGDLYLTIYFADRKKFKQLLSDFNDLSDRMLKRNPKNFEGLRMKGYYHIANNDYKSAITNFEQALAIKGDRPDVKLALVQAMALDGKRDEAMQLARKAIDQHKEFAGLYDFLYLAYAGKKQIDEAEQILKLKASNNPTAPGYTLELAGHYYRAQKAAEMKAALDGILAKPKEFPKAYEMVADFYFRISDLTNAYQTLEAGMKAQPDQVQMFRKKSVELLALMNRRQEAVAQAQKLVEDYKDDPEAKAIRASLRMQGGNRQELDTSIQELIEVKAKMPENPVIRYNLGEAYMTKGDLAKAQTEFQDALKFRAGYIQPKLSLARVNLLKHDFAKAKQLTEEILNVTPGLVLARLAHAQSLFGLRDLPNARTELENVIRMNPATRDGRYLLALVDFTEKKMPEAEKGFLALHQGTPKDGRALFGLVDTYLATNRPDKAKQALEAEIATNPQNVAALKVALANVQARTGNTTEATSLLKNLLNENPKAADLWLTLGDTYRASQKVEDAIQAFNKARELAPQSTAPLMRLAMAYEVSGRKAETSAIYDQILKIDPENPIALNNKAFMMVEGDGDLDQALTYAQKARQQLPNSDDVADTLGWIYIKKSLPDDAAKVFRDLLKKKPEHVTWRYHLAVALFQKGDKLEAKKELNQALQNHPKPEEKQKIDTLLLKIG
ncbi:MAG: tetratricopeptide repeat protein [Bryobacteraceae bacterium]